jgi:hypothetical protein
MQSIPGSFHKELIVIDFKEPMGYILDFLYKIFNIPPVVQYSSSRKLIETLNNITHFIITNIDNKYRFLMAVENHTFIAQVAVEDIPLFNAYKTELQLLLMYLYNYISMYLPESDENVYILHNIYGTYITVTAHVLNIEYDNLVFRP